MAQAPRSSKPNSETPAKPPVSGGGGGEGGAGSVAVTIGGDGAGGGATTPGLVEMVPGGAPGVAGAVSGETAPATPLLSLSVAELEAMQVDWLREERQRNTELADKLTASEAERALVQDQLGVARRTIAELEAALSLQADALKDARGAASHAAAPLPDDADVGALAEALGVELPDIVAVNMDAGVIVTRDGRKHRLPR